VAVIDDRKSEYARHDGWLEWATTISPGEFAATLRHLRSAVRLTQEDLANRAGLSVRAIRNLEQGRSRPYQRTVDLLVDALGPAAENHERLRTPVTAWRGADGRGQPPTVVRTPRQLPAAPRHFVGREAEIRLLDEFAGRAAPDGTARLCLINGDAGVGKSGLASHWAHRIRHLFPDGQLYADLGAAGADERALHRVLRGFLRASGAKPPAAPATLAECSALFRTVLADRRVLILVDDVAAVARLTPILPATNRCLVLATSRKRLPSLSAFHGAHRLTLSPLAESESVRLLEHLVGERMRADPVAAAWLARRCTGRPGPLRAVAAHIEADPGLRPEAWTGGAHRSAIDAVLRSTHRPWG